MVSKICYDPYSSRTKFTDKDGDEWHEVLSGEPVSYNTEHFAVYRNGSNNLIIGCRGSETMHDWVVTDVQLAVTATPCDRMREAQRLAEAMRARYNNVYMTGHSLGGTIAVVTSLKQ